MIFNGVNKAFINIFAPHYTLYMDYINLRQFPDKGWKRYGSDNLITNTKLLTKWMSKCNA